MKKSPRRSAPSAAGSPITRVLKIMARLRAPDGCPWDREQDHRSLRFHAVEEVYELLDAIEAGDEPEMIEELGDLLLQVVFHCQLGQERRAFDFDRVCATLAEKLIRRHPHVFGDVSVKNVDQVWSNWEKIKHAEKAGTRHARPSALDGIPRHLPALLRAEKLIKKARKAGLIDAPAHPTPPASGFAFKRPNDLGAFLFELAAFAQSRGWSLEAILRAKTKEREAQLRRAERRRSPAQRPSDGRRARRGSPRK